MCAYDDKLLVGSKPPLFHARGGQDADLDSRGQGLRVINALLGFLEIGFSCLVDIKELLWVDVDQGKPAALDLNHDAVASTEGVKRVGNRKLYKSRLAGHERFRPIEAVAKFASHN